VPLAGPREIDSRSCADRHSERRVRFRGAMPPWYRRCEKKSRRRLSNVARNRTHRCPLAPQLPDPKLPLLSHGAVNTDHCIPLSIRLSIGYCTDCLESTSPLYWEDYPTTSALYMLLSRWRWRRPSGPIISLGFITPPTGMNYSNRNSGATILYESQPQLEMGLPAANALITGNITGSVLASPANSIAT